MTTILREGDIVRCLESVEADVIGERCKVEIPARSTGAVVTVYEGSEGTEAYEIEFYVADQDSYALATISADKVEDADK